MLSLTAMPRAPKVDPEICSAPPLNFGYGSATLRRTDARVCHVSGLVHLRLDVFKPSSAAKSFVFCSPELPVTEPFGRSVTAPNDYTCIYVYKRIYAYGHSLE